MDQIAKNQYGSDTSGGQEVAVIFTAQVFVYTTGILSQSLLAYLLEPEGRGAYAICITFAQLLGMVFSFSADKGAQYFAMTRQISVSKSLLLSVSVCLVGSGLVMAAVFPLIYSGLPFFQKADASSFQLSLMLIPLLSISFAVQLQLAGLRRFVPLAIFLLAQPIVAVLGIVVLVWKFGLGVDGAILALVASHIVLIAGCALDLKKNIGLTFEMPSFSAFFLVFGYGLRHHVTRVGTEIEPYLGILILGALASRTGIGLFAAASAIMFRITLISSSVVMALYPRITSSRGENLEMIGFCLRVICMTTIVVLVTLLAISTPLVRILLSEAFLPVVPLIWIMAPGVFAYAAANIFVAYFNGINQPEICSWTVWLGLGINVMVLLVLYTKLGIEAAAWAITIGLVVRAILLGFIFHRTTRMSFRLIWLPCHSDFSRLWASCRSLAHRGFLSVRRDEK